MLYKIHTASLWVLMLNITKIQTNTRFNIILNYSDLNMFTYFLNWCFKSTNIMPTYWWSRVNFDDIILMNIFICTLWKIFSFHLSLEIQFTLQIFEHISIFYLNSKKVFLKTNTFLFIHLSLSHQARHPIMITNSWY